MINEMALFKRIPILVYVCRQEKIIYIFINKNMKDKSNACKVKACGLKCINKE